MAVTGKFYGPGVSHILNGAVDWDTDTIHVSLHTATYTPNQDTDDFFNDASNEIAGTNGYTTGGVALGSKVRSYDAGSNEVRLDAADAAWTFTGSKTFRYAVISKRRGGASTADELVGWVDFGSDQTVDSVVFTIAWHAEGAFKAVVA